MFRLIKNSQILTELLKKEVMQPKSKNKNILEDFSHSILFTISTASEHLWKQRFSQKFNKQPMP